MHTPCIFTAARISCFFIGARLSRSPALPAPRLEFYKAQVLDALQHQDDDADAQAFRWVQQQSEAAEISGHVTQNTYPAAAQY
eukprot:scaffold6596_cov18-Tisochrysis_lutea.AAC.1